MTNNNSSMNPNQNVAEFDIFLSDLNGQLRGKRLPATTLDKIKKEGFKMPRSTVGIDFWGDDVIENGLVFETGDSDGLCVPVLNTLCDVTWEENRQQLVAMMTNPDGSPFHADPRQALKSVVDEYAELGLTPVVATELEFYLFDIASIHAKRPLISPISPQDHDFDRTDVYSIDTLDEFQHILSEVRIACEAQGVPADTFISEMGNGQFELNLNHEADALAAADHAIMFKRIVKGIARKHGHLASFMAKPDGAKSGNGFHVHFSILDKDGNNIFNNETTEGSPELAHAAAGLIECMRDSMLIFAPHLNSYRRFTPGAHAPIVANWGYENRTVAVRIPESPNVARRIEHRVAGADANPYLVLAAVLGAALHGIKNKLQAPEPTVGDTYASELPHISLPTEWPDAIRVFDGSEKLKDILSDQLIEVFSAVKLQEFAKFKARVTDAEYETYLGTL